MRLQLSVLAYNLGNMWRRLGLSQRIKSWSLTSLQHRLMKTGGRLVKHARYYWLLLAEGHLNRKLFGYMLRRIWALPVAGRLKRLARSGRSWGVCRRATSERYRRMPLGRARTRPSRRV